jgi:hypothetical protein
LYQAKGYPQAWIKKQLRSIAIRGELTEEWHQRGEPRQLFSVTRNQTGAGETGDIVSY